MTAYNKEGRFLTKENLEKHTVNVLNPVVFIINGVNKTEFPGNVWFESLMEGYLEKQVNNVFLVDWKFDPKWNRIESTGNALADFIHCLFNRTGESYLDIHLVAVLAGSQVASVAGKRLSDLISQQVNRITALDPTYYLINDGNVKLGGENANFSDAIFSDLGEFHKNNDKEYGNARFYVDDEECKGGTRTKNRLLCVI